jgi:glycerophosphoryl diester phosphodiesterase
MKKFFDPEPRLLAHRGMPLEFPENTMISFENAVNFGIDVIETDTHLTKDYQFIISHDADISRVSNGSGLISDYTVEELKKFDAGYNFTTDEGNSFPFRGKGISFITVDEILSAFPNQKFNIDLKVNNPSQVKYWADLIKNYGAEDRVLTASQYSQNLIEVRKIFPNMATSFSAREVFKFYIANKCGRLKFRKFTGDALQIPVRMGPFHLIKPKFVKNAHKWGIKIHVWTINEQDQMKELFDMGIDAIFTDNPHAIKPIIQEKFK